MNAVRKSNASIVAGTLKAAESRPQHLESTESPFGNRVAHPQRCWIEPENMTNLQNQAGILSQLRHFLRLAGNQAYRFFDKDIFSHHEQFAAGFEVRLRRSHDDRGVNF